MKQKGSAAPEHPGIFIVEEMKARGWAKRDLAYILGMSLENLSRVLNGKVGVSTEMAVSLGEAFGVPADFFANLQRLYDLGRPKQPGPRIKTRGGKINVENIYGRQSE